ncbi:carbohydrate ABC transporter permease [Mangrovicoccus sp. HB161399]|uniref:carbohydrate ABC transporter permease n=1 Tax=Mangrovicoccus sp. HB161399 TaxID=2720392 RepID=UPI00155820F1|nr:sugar ABC transporter permease [Mangrovicoccus sp. HB161399]
MTAATPMEMRDRRFGWMLTAPGLALLAAVVLFPILWAGTTSFFDYTLIMPGYDNFAGFGNYAKAAGDGEFLHAAWITVLFVLAVVSIQFAIGLLVALMLNDTERGKGVYYLILLCPLLINPVVVGLMWRMILHPTLGIVNWLLSTVGIEPVNWLGAPDMAFWTVVLVDIWHQVSFMVVLLLAGLSSLPAEPYEAARVDGASALQRFWHITLPMMKPVIAITLLIRMIFAIKTYDIIYIMTRGGPGTATDLISYFIYRRAFVSLDLGEACAMAAMLLIVIAGMTALLWRTMRTAQDD